MPIDRSCITSYTKKAGRSPWVLLFAVSKLLMPAEISVFSCPEDGFYSFLQEHPCLAQGAALAGSGYSGFWQQLAAQPPLKVNLQSEGRDKVREGCERVLAVA